MDKIVSSINWLWLKDGVTIDILGKSIFILSRNFGSIIPHPMEDASLGTREDDNKGVKWGKDGFPRN